MEFVIIISFYFVTLIISDFEASNCRIRREQQTKMALEVVAYLEVITYNFL